jgi:hypothetical protein
VPNKFIVLPLVVSEPTPIISILRLVKVPPEDNIAESTCTVVAEVLVTLLPVKSKTLKDELFVKVGTAEPDIIDRFGKDVKAPGKATVATVYVLVTAASDTNPPVPVQVKFVIVAILNTTCAAVGVASMILYVLKLIVRPLVPVELNIPVDKSAPSVNVPAVSVYVPVIDTALTCLL